MSFSWYGLLIGVACLVGLEIAKIAADKIGFDSKELDWLFLPTVVAGVVGARLFFVFNNWSYFAGDWGMVVRVWEGGLMIWGAIGLSGLFLFVMSRARQFSYLKLLDSLSVGLPLAQVVGRIANGFNGEIIGLAGQPLWLYELLVMLVLFGILVRMIRDYHEGILVGMYLLTYGVVRSFLDTLRFESFNGSNAAAMVTVLVGAYLIARSKTWSTRSTK
jgi:prolipoprotein diacylglyceryltransferase